MKLISKIIGLTGMFFKQVLKLAEEPDQASTAAYC